MPQVDSADGGAQLGAAVAALWELTLLLREQCPWDRAQTAGTIVPHTLEEAWEVADVARAVEAAIAAGTEPDLAAFEDELGDLLFQVCFLAMWCGERDATIDLGSVAQRIFDKLVRRHPHVFGAASGGSGDEEASTADEVRGQWEQVKREREDRGLFEGVPAAMPQLARARKVQSRAASIGFDYGTAIEALRDLEGEVGELRVAIEQAQASGSLPAGESSAADPRTEAELGDVLFAATNVARLLRVEPELALHGSSRTFQARVEQAVALAADAGEDFAALGLDAQEAWYQRAKASLTRS